MLAIIQGVTITKAIQVGVYNGGSTPKGTQAGHQGEAILYERIKPTDTVILAEMKQRL